ncbi:MAG: hypothetical protein DWH91_19890 [Planctomycetota bacterium]|nr:MAG: hypothetical protein DWH91_19890 [Planctomycetota bacterium]
MYRRVWHIAALAILAVYGTTPAQAQFRFNVEAVFMDRNDGDGGTLIEGQDSISSTPAYDFQTGYRFTLGGSFQQFDVEVIGMQIDDWDSRSSGTLVSELVLDDTADNPIVVPVIPANQLGFNALVKVAANSADETSESERLQSVGTWFVDGTSRFRDYQVNIGTNPKQYPWQLSVGYRQLRLDETQGFGVTGTFDALDSDDAAVFGDLANDANDSLSHGALIDAGFSLRQGAGDGYDAFDTDVGPDQLQLYYANSTKNTLNGAQVSGSYSLHPGDMADISIFSRAGIYHNQMRAELGEYLIGSGNDDSMYEATIRGDKHGVAFSSSLGLKLAIPVTDYISLTGGYEAIYVANLALASNQNDGIEYGPLGNRRYSVQNGDKLIMHGATLGMLLTW